MTLVVAAPQVVPTLDEARSRGDAIKAILGQNPTVGGQVSVYALPPAASAGGGADEPSGDWARRLGEARRATAETRIEVRVDIDGSGEGDVATGASSPHLGRSGPGWGRNRAPTHPRRHRVPRSHAGRAGQARPVRHLPPLQGASASPCAPLPPRGAVTAPRCHRGTCTSTTTTAQRTARWRWARPSTERWGRARASRAGATRFAPSTRPSAAPSSMCRGVPLRGRCPGVAGFSPERLRARRLTRAAACAPLQPSAR